MDIATNTHPRDGKLDAIFDSDNGTYQDPVVYTSRVATGKLSHEVTTDSSYFGFVSPTGEEISGELGQEAINRGYDSCPKFVS
jgi:hypothetical protein